MTNINCCIYFLFMLLIIIFNSNVSNILTKQNKIRIFNLKINHILNKFNNTYSRSLHCLHSVCFSKCFFGNYKRKKWKAYTKSDVPGPYPYDYPYLKNNKNICNRNIFLLISIITACSQLEERMAVRTVYKNIDSSIKFHFFIGFTSTTCQEEYEMESLFYNDISQMPIQESFANETLFTLYLHKILPTLCPNAQYYGKMDADQYINYSKLVKMLKRYRKYNNIYYVCRHYPRLMLITDQSYKYSSHKSIEDYYKLKLSRNNVQYFTGSFALWSSYLSNFIYRESLKETHIIRMDDQHVAWLIFRLNENNINISYIDLKCILSKDDLIKNCNFSYKNAYGIHQLKGDILYTFNKIIN